MGGGDGAGGAQGTLHILNGLRGLGRQLRASGNAHSVERSAGFTPDQMLASQQ